MVLLDVVVTDNNGNPVKGLPQSDFRVYEDGKEQTIASFQEHSGAPMKKVDLPAMPSNVYTNFPAVETADSINVILMDSLNTQAADQSFAHQQVIKYLKTIPPGARVAIFTLSSRLRMLQEFTTDSTRLLAALNDRNLSTIRPSGALKSQTEQQADQSIINNAILNRMGAPAPTTGAEDAVDPVSSLRELLAEKDLAIDQQRIGMTLEALQHLARYLSGFPGRKNVIWVSGAFPFVFFPDQELPTPSTTMRSFLQDFQKTADLCTAAQMAIYPVAAEGTVNLSLYQADASEISQQRPSQMTQNNVAQMNKELGTRSWTHVSMETLAKDTGGRAFYDTNGLKDVLARVTNEGMHYYTLSYSPTNTQLDNRYRQTKVELAKGKYKLSYRRGYYVTDNKMGQPVTETSNPLLSLMSYGLPDVSQLIYKVSVTPIPDSNAGNASRGTTALNGASAPYALDFGISLYHMRFERLPDGTRRAKLNVRVIVYDDGGKPLNMTGHEGVVNLTPQAFAEAAKAGLQLHEELDLPANSEVHLRTGVYDANSGNAGTLGIRLHTGKAK